MSERNAVAEIAEMVRLDRERERRDAARWRMFLRRVETVTFRSTVHGGIYDPPIGVMLGDFLDAEIAHDVMRLDNIRTVGQPETGTPSRLESSRTE